MFVLGKGHLRFKAKDGAAGREKQRLDITAILPVVDLGELFPNGMVFDFFHNAFQDYGFVGFFRAKYTVRVGGDIFRFSRAWAGAEPEGILPPDPPDEHEVRASIRARGGDPIIVRFFEALESPGPGLEAGGRVGWILQGVGPMGTAALGFDHDGSFPGFQSAARILARDGVELS